MNPLDLIIVDDDKNTATGMEMYFSRKGLECKYFTLPEKALDFISTNKAHVLVTDLRMDGMSGIELLSRVREVSPDTSVILITAFGTVDLAVSAIKQGASDFILKPVDLPTLYNKIKNFIDYKKLKIQNKLLTDFVESNFAFDGIVGSSQQMQKIVKIVRKISAIDTSVVIFGETGVGKEILAKAIHQNSSRAKGNFVAVNCAALNRNLIESELFGHTKSSFTGANKERTGKVELADKGTLFLDEIGDVPLDVQTKLLRVLETKTFEKVGANSQQSSDFRLVCATNKDLAQEVRKGLFREDLYYRIKVVSIIVPPLRERKSDIKTLIDYFIQKFALKHSMQAVNIGEEALKLLLRYNWPGNIRELKNIIEYAIINSENNKITTTSLPDELFSVSQEVSFSDFADKDNISYKEKMHRFEKAVIYSALKKNDFHGPKTAKYLDISLRSLRNKMKEYNLKKSQLLEELSHAEEKTGR